MPKPSFRSAAPSVEVAGRLLSSEQKSSSTVWRAASERIRLWAARHRQRRRLSELADRNDRLLRDVGISPGEARIEAAKFFWQR